MDMLGHVNNTVYFRYMEQARIEWMAALVGAHEAEDGPLPVVVNASCNFRVPLVYPADVEVRMKGIPKEGKHEALADILESIDELRYYREHFLKV